MPAKSTLPAKILDARSLPGSSRTLCGVYFLLSGDEVIYVGQSVNILRRLYHHRPKGYDRWAYIEVPRSEQLEVEGRWIKKLRPKYNLPRGGPRPNSGPKPRPDSLTAAVTFWVSPDDRARLVRLASRAGMSLSEWCRRVVLEGANQCRP